MSALISRLPGDIFTTFLRGTPTFVCGTDAVIHGPDTRPKEERYGEWFASPSDFWQDDIGEWIPDGIRSVKTTEIEVDLEAQMARVFVAWWARDRYNQHPPDPEWDLPEWDLLTLARYGVDMTPEQIDAFARLVLRLAGRSA